MKLRHTIIAFSITTALGLGNIAAEAATSADLTLTGTVDQDCSVALNTSSYSVDLLNGEADSTVATVTETCNDADGFVVSFSSANSGVLQNDDDANEQKAYTISYGSGSGSIDTQSLSSTQSIAYSTYTAGNAVPLRMNLNAHTVGVLAAGTWSDVVTVSIAAQ